MTNLEIAIQQARIQDALQAAANRYGWDSEATAALGGLAAYDDATEKHDIAFRQLSRQERKEYFAATN